MPVFISYSHKDKDFVDALALQLVRHNVNVWFDRWELHIGIPLLTAFNEQSTDRALCLSFSPKVQFRPSGSFNHLRTLARHLGVPIRFVKSNEGGPDPDDEPTLAEIRIPTLRRLRWPK
jgi:TIR domain